MCICMSVHGVLSNTVSQNSPGYEVDIASTGVFYVAQPAEYFSLWEKHIWWWVQNPPEPCQLYWQLFSIHGHTTP